MQHYFVLLLWEISDPTKPMARLTLPTPLIERSHVAPSGGVMLIKAAYKR